MAGGPGEMAGGLGPPLALPRGQLGRQRPAQCQPPPVATPSSFLFFLLPLFFFFFFFFFFFLPSLPLLFSLWRWHGWPDPTRRRASADGGRCPRLGPASCRARRQPRTKAGATGSRCVGGPPGGPLSLLRPPPTADNLPPLSERPVHGDRTLPCLGTARPSCDLAKSRARHGPATDRPRCGCASLLLSLTLSLLPFGGGTYLDGDEVAATKIN